MPSLQGASHIALTVRDMDASAEWYQRVLGLQELRRYGSDGAGTPRILLLDPASFFVVGLCQPDDGSSAAFDHRHTGLDHFAFKVTDDAELDRWIAHLDELGVAHSPVRVLDLGRFVSFEDPDGIQFELWLQPPDPVADGHRAEDRGAGRRPAGPGSAAAGG
ncbi:VOC family protein [Blastococcus sp. BMG 814]|uniref:VOC family protein n=1 Tax=Blastococcus carthaginiensis TaxID=3050034 RepID=A0ABT9IID7_9ACTN|nr:VOC family protein [Blastococcus carthaginiensis]MDP5185343.1 VOC family protein [Blastococcus carthaginiensis]